MKLRNGDITSLHSLITLILMSSHPGDVILIFLIASEISCSAVGLRKNEKGTGSGRKDSKGTVDGWMSEAKLLATLVK